MMLARPATQPLSALLILSVLLLFPLTPSVAEEAAAQASTTQHAPKVTAKLSTTGTVWVGQAVSMQVSIAAPGYFDSSVSFDIPDPQGVLLMPPASHPVISTKVIDDVRYTVQQYELRAWSMRAGQQTIPAINARFSFKPSPLDTDGIPAEVTIPSQPFSVKKPPGAEQLGTVISARNLKFEENWSPEPGEDTVKAGTAFTRTITFTAPDVPGMIFPPFPADEIDGVGVYEKRQLLDSDNRGTLVGVRKDKITYLCQRAGQFVIPETRFTWFDLDTEELRTEVLPARTLHVKANPAMASAGTSEQAGISNPLRSAASRNTLIGGVVVLLLLAGVLYFASRNRRVRAAIKRAAIPFQAVHLQPLNPTERKSGSRAEA